MVAGPFRSGAGANDPTAADANLRLLSLAAIDVFDRGHIPLIAVHAALPLIELAGEHRYGELMLPISLELADRCDACLRIGGPSAGADKEAERFARLGKPVYASVEEISDGR